MKAKELREKSVEELNTEMLALYKEQFNLRIQKGVGQSPRPQQIKNARRGIARIKTILNQKGSTV